jgi:crotonobetaine/carnitine-CoA ligase
MTRHHETTVGECIRARAAAFPDRVAIEMIGEGRETYSECFAASSQLARGLLAAGVRRNDTVVVMAPNCLTTIHAWLGVNLAGATEVAINTAYRARLLEHAVNICGARVMIAAAEFLPVLYESEDALPHLEQIICFDAPGAAPLAALPAFRRIAVVPLGEVLARASDAELPAVRTSDIASVIYTSGTTGPAKGIMMPHAQVCGLARQSIDGLRLDGTDAFYCFHPLFHMAGKFMAVFATLMVGGRVILDRTFKADLWVDRVRAYGATVGLAHGPMVEMIHAQPERREDREHNVRRLLTAPFPKAIAHQFEARFGLKGIEVWGMTEINIGTWRPYDDPLRPGSCGRISDEWVELRVVDPETDEELPAGQAGELVVRPKKPFVFMAGYIGMPEKTLQAWRNLWFHTGDIGYFDNDGYGYFVDRLGDRIRRRAENISSYDIEAAAAAHPAVAEAAAVGVASEFEADDEIKICLVAKPGMTIAPEDMLRYLAGVLPHYMVPRYIEFMPALPRTPTNKIKKAELRGRGATPDTWDRKQAGLALKDVVASVRSGAAQAGPSR